MSYRIFNSKARSSFSKISRKLINTVSLRRPISKKSMGNHLTTRKRKGLRISFGIMKKMLNLKKKTKLIRREISARMIEKIILVAKMTAKTMQARIRCS